MDKEKIRFILSEVGYFVLLMTAGLLLGFALGYGGGFAAGWNSCISFGAALP